MSGQILVIKGADFSTSPKSVNIADFPIIKDSLVGYYTGLGSVTEDTQYAENAIVEMPATFMEAPSFWRFPGQLHAPVYPFQGTIFKGNVIRFEDSLGNSVRALISDDFVFNLTEGLTFSFMYWRNGTSTGNNRTLLGIEGLALQLRSNATETAHHLSIGTGENAVSYDVGLHGATISGAELITISILGNTVKVYRNAELKGTVDASAHGWTNTVEGRVGIGANWAGNGGLIGHQVKQIHIHGKELSLGEIQTMHAVMAELLA